MRTVRASAKPDQFGAAKPQPKDRRETAYENTLTARAITRPTTVREIRDCSAIVSFAHRAMGMTSVGLNAVLVVRPRMR